MQAASPINIARNPHPPDSFLYWKHAHATLSQSHKKTLDSLDAKDKILMHTMKNRDVTVKKLRHALMDLKEVMRRKDETLETMFQMASMRRMPLSSVHARFRDIVDSYEGYLGSGMQRDASFYNLHDVHREIVERSIEELMQSAEISLETREHLRHEFAFQTRNRNEYVIRALPLDQEMRDVIEKESLHERQVRDHLTPVVEHEGDVFEKAKVTTPTPSRMRPVPIAAEDNEVEPTDTPPARLSPHPPMPTSVPQRQLIRNPPTDAPAIPEPQPIDLHAPTTTEVRTHPTSIEPTAHRTIPVQTDDPLNVQLTNPNLQRDRQIQTADFSDAYDLYYLASKLSGEVQKITAEHKSKKKRHLTPEELCLGDEMHFMLHNAKIGDMIDLSIDMALNPEDEVKCTGSLRLLESLYKKIARVLHQVVPKYARKRDTLFHLRNDIRYAHKKMHDVQGSLWGLMQEAFGDMQRLQQKAVSYVDNWETEQNERIQDEVDVCIAKQKQLDEAKAKVEARHEALDTREDELLHKADLLQGREEEVQREKEYVQSLIVAQEQEHKELVRLKEQIDMHLQQLNRVRAMMRPNSDNPTAGGTPAGTNTASELPTTTTTSDTTQLLAALQQEVAAAQQQQQQQFQQHNISALLGHKELETLISQHRKLKKELEDAHVALNQEMIKLQQIHIGSRDYVRVDRKIIYRRQKIEALRDRVRQVQVHIVDFLESQQFSFEVPSTPGSPRDSGLRMSELAAGELASRAPAGAFPVDDSQSDVLRSPVFRNKRVTLALEPSRQLNPIGMRIQSVAPQVRIEVTPGEDDSNTADEDHDYLEGRSEAEKLLYLIGLCDASAHANLIPTEDVSVIGEFLTCCNKTSNPKLQPILHTLKSNSRVLYSVASGPIDRLVVNSTLLSEEDLKTVREGYRHVMEHYLAIKEQLYEEYPVVMQQIDLQWNSGRKSKSFFKRRQQQIGNLVRKSPLSALKGNPRKKNLYNYRGHRIRKGKKDAKSDKNAGEKYQISSAGVGDAQDIEGETPKKSKVEVTLPSTTTMSPIADGDVINLNVGQSVVHDQEQKISSFPSLVPNTPERRALDPVRKTLHLTKFAQEKRQDVATHHQLGSWAHLQPSMGRARRYLMSEGHHEGGQDDDPVDAQWQYQHRPEAQLPVINIGL